MAIRPDIAVYNHHNQLTIAVEIKRKLGTTTEWAAQMRANLLANGYPAKLPFFLLALPDRFYLWTQTEQENAEPIYVVDAALLLRPYFERAHLEPETIYETSFELIILSWLDNLTYPAEQDTLRNQDQDWIIDSGFLNALIGGRIKLEAALEA